MRVSCPLSLLVSPDREKGSQVVSFVAFLYDALFGGYNETCEQEKTLSLLQLAAGLASTDKQWGREGERGDFGGLHSPPFICRLFSLSLFSLLRSQD